MVLRSRFCNIKGAVLHFIISQPFMLNVDNNEAAIYINVDNNEARMVQPPNAAQFYSFY